MATRTSEAAVRLVMQTKLTSEQVGAFIADAELWVTEELVNQQASLSDARLEMIERYLACALIRTSDLGIKSVTFESAAEQYQVDATVSDYLLKAASMDPTGHVRLQFLPGTPASPGARKMIWHTGKGFRRDSLRREDFAEDPELTHDE